MHAKARGKLNFWRTGLLIAVTALLAACKGDPGTEGVLMVTSTWTTDVLSIDASSLGIVSSGTHPAADTAQELTAVSGTVIWSSDWQGGTTNYSALVELTAVTAQEGKKGLLPKLLIEVPVLTARDGHDGTGQSLRFDFEKATLKVYINSSPFTGSQVSSN